MSQRPLEARVAVARARTPGAATRERVVFRVASDADVPALVPLINAAYMREAHVLPPPRIDEELLAEAIARETSRMIVAEIDGEPAGCVCVTIPDEDACFGIFAVSPKHQGHGLGPLLVAHAEEVALAEGRAVMRLDCAKETGMPAYYESLGYTVEAESPGHFYRNRKVRKGPITRVDMMKRLR
jgi:GNAT superfamily N-acetyltransferase